MSISVSIGQGSDPKFKRKNETGGGTDEMMNVRSLEKSADADLLREMIGFAADGTGDRQRDRCWFGENSPMRLAQRNDLVGADAFRRYPCRFQARGVVLGGGAMASTASSRPWPVFSTSQRKLQRRPYPRRSATRSDAGGVCVNLMRY